LSIYVHFGAKISLEIVVNNPYSARKWLEKSWSIQIQKVNSLIKRCSNLDVYFRGVNIMQ